MKTWHSMIPQSDAQFFVWDKFNGRMSPDPMHDNVVLISWRSPVEFEGEHWFYSRSPFDAQLYRFYEEFATRP